MVLLGPGVIEETKANSTKADNRLVDMIMARHPSGGDVPATVGGYGALRPVQLGMDRGIHLQSLHREVALTEAHREPVWEPAMPVFCLPDCRKYAEPCESPPRFPPPRSR